MRAADLEDLMPIVAHRGWGRDGDFGLRDRKGYCPVCALVDEIIGWTGDKTDAWWAMAWLLGKRGEEQKEQQLPIDIYLAVTNIVNASDADDLSMPRAVRLRKLLGMKK